MKGLDEAAHDFVELLESKQIPYAIMGGFAVRLHALPRPTFDIDFTILLARDQLPALYLHAEQLGYQVPEPQRQGWIDTVNGLPVVKCALPLGDRAIDVDLFLAETPFQKELLCRRQQHQADGWSAWFVTAEDLILLKLLANRPKDRVDVADILFIQPQLDAAYMREWAQKLGTLEALETVLAASKDRP
jgi:hypothetical protein